MIDKKDINTIELVDVHVNREPTGIFAFDLTYRVAYKNGKIEEIRFPRVENPFYEHNLEICYGPWKKEYIETKSPCLLREFFDVDHNTKYIMARTVIKEADPVEMTMDEIEAALGKRVKIVNDKIKETRNE